MAMAPSYVHENVSQHNCDVVKSFMASEKVVVANFIPFFNDPITSFYYHGQRHLFVKRNISPDLSFISVSERHPKKTNLSFAIG